MILIVHVSDEHTCHKFTVYFIMHFLILILTCIPGLSIFLRKFIIDNERSVEFPSLLSHHISHAVELVHEFAVCNLALVGLIDTQCFYLRIHSELVVPPKLVAYILKSLERIHKLFVFVDKSPYLECSQFGTHGIKAFMPQNPKIILTVLFVVYLSLYSPAS